jgi:hypothetical protein
MTAKKVGVVLAILHAVALVAFVIYIHSDAAERSQGTFYWLAWFPVDFPWSILDLVPGWVMPDSLDEVMGIPRYKLVEGWRIFVHGVIGALWWYQLPRIATALFERWRARAN